MAHSTFGSRESPSIDVIKRENHWQSRDEHQNRGHDPKENGMFRTTIVAAASGNSSGQCFVNNNAGEQEKTDVFKHLSGIIRCSHLAWVGVRPNSCVVGKLNMMCKGEWGDAHSL